MKVFDKLEFSRRPATVDVKIHLYTKIGKETQKDRSILVNRNGELYSIQLASGNRINYLICDNSTQVRCGNGQQLYLKVAEARTIGKFFNNELSASQRDIMYKLGKQQKIAIEEDTTFDDIKDILLDRHEQEPLFYHLTTPIPEESILALSRDELQTLMDLALTDGVTKDPRINYLYRGMIPVVNPNLLSSPSEVMPFNPHGILVTYTKVGKTTTGQKVGVVHDRPTPANLLGFSTAQRGSQKEGALNNAVSLQTIDDISELREGEISAKGFLNIMEQGDIKISRGYGIHTKAFCPLLFTSNPLQEQMQIHPKSIDMYYAETLLLFQDIIRRIHDNPSAIGSRIGLLLYFPKMEPADISTAVPYHVSEKLRRVLETAQVMLANPFTRLLKEDSIREWLSSRDTQIKKYRKKIKSILENEQVKDVSWIMNQVLDGQRANYLHLKGFPFRQAAMDHLHELIHMGENEDFTDDLLCSIINRADGQLKDTFDLLVYPSLGNLMNIFDSNVKEALLSLHYRNLARYPSYETILMHTVAGFALKDRVEGERIVPLADLKDSFLDVVREIRDKLWFNTFPKFTDIVIGHKESINSHRGDLKFSLRSEDDVLCIVVPPEYEWFEYVCRQPLISSPENVTQSTQNNGSSSNGANNKNILRDLKTSPKPPKPPIERKNMGEMGEMGDISKSVRDNSEKNQEMGDMGENNKVDSQVLAGYSKLTAEQVEWVKTCVLSEPDIPLPFFRSKFKDQYGMDFPNDEIEQAFTMVKKNLEVNKK